MSKEYTLEQLFECQRNMDKKLLKLQKRTPERSEPVEVSGFLENEPIYDLYRIGDVLHIELELPGVVEQDISVDLTPGYLKVTGKVEKTTAEENIDFLVCQRQRGTFEYMFNLPIKNMTTRHPPKLHHGVLTLQLQRESSKENL